MQKCGPKSDGYEGQKYSTTISTCAALTLWFCTLHPQERVDEWVIDEATGQCSGLPTHARIVSEFMLGLKTMKAKSGEVSQSACALMLNDIYRLYHHCVGRDMPEAETPGDCALCHVFVSMDDGPTH
ncbi:hypothetical protein PAXRUDRAFT_22437 [Paxillus rubicundulus Ve08.2h10]|uniref:Uncharacterized protein n=1 Tax=Paxillus rubicundulus Ve08.2h10 TaxID=930991 RepID=A0A0D0C8W3_9AGAM|nr:hypothetical protein PAXRUDRAFT_22437 [Paxillus rubicundulus Ve08.2h10]